MQKDFDSKWHEVAEEVMKGMKEWRIAHPRATLCEIESALDERMAKLRVRMLEDAAMASAAADITVVANGAEGERGPEGVQCLACGQRVTGRGKQVRRLTSQDNQMLSLERSYAVCPGCGAGFFPPG